MHTVVTAVRTERILPALTTYRVTVRDGLNGFSLYGTPAPPPVMLNSEEFDLTVTQGAANFPYPGLSMTSGHPRYYTTIINGDTTGAITAKPYDPPNTTALPDNRPLQTNPAPLAGGQNFDASVIRGRTVDYENALALLEGIRGINIVVTPDRTDIAVQRAVLTHCTNLFDRVRHLRCRARQPAATQGNLARTRSIRASRSGIARASAPCTFRGSRSPHSIPGSPSWCPPAGTSPASMRARMPLAASSRHPPESSDRQRCVGRGSRMSDNDQGVVNLKGVNVIRVFQAPVHRWSGERARQPRTRTGSTSTSAGCSSSSSSRSRPAFAGRCSSRTTWRSGRAQADDHGVPDAGVARRRAVRRERRKTRSTCASTTCSTRPTRGARRLTIEIGVRPSYPAEFIVVRIGIWQGGRTSRILTASTARSNHAAAKIPTVTSTSSSRSTASRRPTSASAPASAPASTRSSTARAARTRRSASCPA